MRAVTRMIAAALALTATACASGASSALKSSPAVTSPVDSNTMPSVTGKNLQVAEDAIESAGGDPDKIKVTGGGDLGIVIKSNWQVCTQSPAAGEALPAAPELTVDRSCPTTTPASPAPASPTSASGGSGTPAPLTVTTSKDLAALLTLGDNCDASVGAFAAKYAEQEIEFDGSVSALTNEGGARYDLLLAPGDDGADSGTGPTFQYRDVSTADLHFTGSPAPGSVGLGDKFHLIAQVGEYESGTCLFLLTPVSTQAR